MLSPELPLFAYGTLRDAGLVRELVGRPLRPVPARLPGFRLLEVPGFPHPSVAAAPGASVPGSLYRGLTAGDYRRLDAYEGVGEGLYRRITAPVVPESGPGSEPAWVYLLRGAAPEGGGA